MQLPGSQVSFTRFDRLDNDPVINLLAFSLGHQRRRLLAEVSGGISAIISPSSRTRDLALRAGFAPWQHDARKPDEVGAPRGWLIQAELMAGYRYLGFPFSDTGHRLSAVAAMAFTFFAGGDRLGLTVRFATGLTWAPWEEPGSEDTDHRVLRDVGLSLGVMF